MGAPGPLADADHAVPGLHPGCGHIRQARPRMLISLGDAMLPVCMERSCPDRSARFAIRKTSQACALQGFDRHGAGGAQVVRGVPAAHAWRGERHPIAGAQRLHAGPHGRAAGRATDGALTARVCEKPQHFSPGCTPQPSHCMEGMSAFCDAVPCSLPSSCSPTAFCPREAAAGGVVLPPVLVASGVHICRTWCATVMPERVAVPVSHQLRKRKHQTVHRQVVTKLLLPGVSNTAL